MAWVTPKTWVAGVVVSASDLNTYLRDNLNETMAAKATTAGYTFSPTGVNGIAQRPLEKAAVETSETRANAAYGDCATVGPAVTVSTGTRALIFMGVRAQHSITDVATLTSYAISGATTVSASDTWGIIIDGLAANNPMSYSRVFMHLGITSGTNTFTMKYRTNSGTGTWVNRHLCVMVI